MTMTRFNDSRFEVYTKIGPDEDPIAIFRTRKELLVGLLDIMPGNPNVSILVKHPPSGKWEYWRDGHDYPVCEFEGFEPQLMQFLGMAPERMKNALPSNADFASEI